MNERVITYSLIAGLAVALAFVLWSDPGQEERAVNALLRARIIERDKMISELTDSASFYMLAFAKKSKELETQQAESLILEQRIERLQRKKKQALAAVENADEIERVALWREYFDGRR